MPDRTAVEDVQGESQSRQQALMAGDREINRSPVPTPPNTSAPRQWTSKAAAAAGVPSIGPTNTVTDRRRRRFVWSCVVAFLAAWFIAFFRFFLPRVLYLNRLPSSRLDIQPIMRSVLTKNICRSTGFGWTEHLIGFLSFTRAAHSLRLHS